MAVALKIDLILNSSQKDVDHGPLIKALEKALSIRLGLEVSAKVSSLGSSGSNYSAQLGELGNQHPNDAKSLMTMTARIIREQCPTDEDTVVYVTYGPLHMEL